MHAIRMAHDLRGTLKGAEMGLRNVAVRAGASQAVEALGNRFVSGTLAPKFSTTSRVAEDVRGVGGWLRVPSVSLPFGFPMAPEMPGEPPVFCMRALTVLEELRHCALSALGPEWGETSPRVPVTKGELKGAKRWTSERAE